MRELNYYDKRGNWDFGKYGIKCVYLTNWDMIKILKSITNRHSKVLDLGTGGGEKVIKEFPRCGEILGTDFSPEMINTANESLLKSKKRKQNITFRVMDNLNMDVPEEYFDVVVARHTVTDPKQIMKCLKPGGYLIIRGVDKADCLDLKMLFGRGQGFHDKEPISIVDYKNVIDAGFRDVELVPICSREFFKDRESLKEFLEDVPILHNFSEETLEDEPYVFDDEGEKLLDEYIKKNTYHGKIKLLRRYYGITARK